MLSHAFKTSKYPLFSKRQLRSSRESGKHIHTDTHKSKHPSDKTSRSYAHTNAHSPCVQIILRASSGLCTLGMP